ncbi:MAG: hypothetical protein ACTINL_12560 [Serratia proteamaculans]
MIRKNKILNCNECGSYFPINEAACPVCRHGDFNTRTVRYVMVFAVFFILFLLGCFFSPLISFILCFSVFVLSVIATDIEYGKAVKNNGYYQTEKTEKYKKKLASSLEKGLFITSKVKHQEPNGGSVIASDKKHKNFDSFNNELSVLWGAGKEPASIEFSYIDSKGNRTRREVLLFEVSESKWSDIYFIGTCMESFEERTFKLERIASKITYEGKKYSKAEFIDDVLYLDSSDYL